LLHNICNILENRILGKENDIKNPIGFHCKACNAGISVREFEVDMFGSVIDKEESKLAVIDPFTNEKIQDAKDDDDDYVEVDFESL
jgi:hypothetical protein